MTTQEAIERFECENEKFRQRCIDPASHAFYSVDICRNNMAIEALKKQIPKNPYVNKNATHKTYTVEAGQALRCSVCQFGLFGLEVYCPYCGQKLTEAK